MKHKHAFLILFIVLAIAVAILAYVSKNQGGILSLIPGASGGGTGGGNGASGTSTGQNPNSTAISWPLTEGSSGKAVAMIQAALGYANPTGVWDDVMTGNLAEAPSGFFDDDTDEITLDDFTDGVANLSASDLAKFPLQNGSNNNFVKDVQILCGVSVDGIWGSQTGAAVQKLAGKTALQYVDYIALINKVLGLNIQPQSQATPYNVTTAPTINTQAPAYSYSF